MKNIAKRATVLVLIACFIAALCVSLTACNNDKDPNKLYVGLECTYSPFNYTQNDAGNGAVQIYDTNYKPVNGCWANGYDVMIAKRVAQELGKELVIVRCVWEGLIPAVNAGTLDMIIAGMSPTEERLREIDFSDEYYQSNLVVVVRKNSAYANATSLSALSGARIVAQQGTFHDVALENQGGQYGIVRQTPMKTFPLMIAALSAGTVDGYIAEEPGAIENCAANQDFTYIRLTNNGANGAGFTATAADTAIAVGIKKGNAIKEQINEALAKISQEERAAMMNEAISLSSGENIVEEE